MTPVLRIDVNGDEVEITGPRERVKQAVDTSLLNYVEIDGFVRAVLHDPVPHAGHAAANAAVRRLRLAWSRERRA